MERLIKYIGYSLFLPIWWLQLLVPREKNIWVFGAWYGQRYSDNSMYLFEHVNANDKKINAIWITKNRVVFDYVKKKGYSCYMANSILGVYYCLLSKYVIVSSVKKDVNEYWINGAIKIQLWHGNPMKKIGMDDKYSDSNSFFYKVLVRHIFSMAYEFDYQYVVSNAASFSKNMASAFNIPIGTILETGCPRNDIFYSKKRAQINEDLKKKFADCSLVYYLPTFRDKGKKQSLLDLDSYKESHLQRFLEKENMVFVTKAHFATKPHEQSKETSDRIYHLPDDDLIDINFLLKDADILVTDYSGAYFDFLLTEKPIIFAAFDLKDYLSASREMYFNYENIIAGPIVDNWENLFIELEKIQSDSKYRYLLSEKNDIFNKYHDNNNSKRVYNAVLNLSK